jgi:hypothetical protein
MPVAALTRNRVEPWDSPPEVPWLQEHHQWPGLAAIGSIVRRREVNGVTECETAYYLLSRPLSPTRFAEVARAPWGIGRRSLRCAENCSVWRRPHRLIHPPTIETGTNP